MVNKKDLEKILVEKGSLNEKQIAAAREEGKEKGISLRDAVIRKGLMKEEDIVNLEAESYGVPFVDLSDYIISDDVIKLVPERLARNLTAIPIFKIGKSLTVATTNPNDIVAIDELSRHTGLAIEPVISTASAIKGAIDRSYGVTGGLREVVKQVEKIKLGDTEGATTEALQKIADEAPVVKLVNTIIVQAVKDRASDIHVEPEEDLLRVRLRIDGVLNELDTIPKDLESAITSRIKVLSKMDIAEKRKPQDGRFKLKVEGKDIDLRVSVFPMSYGENVVMRILDRESALRSLTEIGMDEETLKKYEKLIQIPFGIVLVTGPTGCGKTTTLYASIQKINDKKKNIVTIEDPIEYHMKVIRQTQVNPKAGLTFANGLRAMLRQDPDVIMVGEIRDRETAEIAIQSAMTGHLVLSSLHTNDAPGALSRLIDMEMEPFLISSSVAGVLAQRLVRVICDKCKEKYSPPDELVEELSLVGQKEHDFYHGKGCNLCKNTGYVGRTAIFELLPVNEEMRRLILAKASLDEFRKAALNSGMQTLRKDGINKVLKGITTVEEVLAVTQAQ